MKTIFILLLAAISLVACKPTTLSEQELTTYIQDVENGLINKQQRKGIDLTVNYRPTDLLVAQELRAKPQQSPALIDSLKTKYKDYSYFVLNLSKENKEVLKQMGDFSNFSNTLQTLSFDMGNHVNLTTSERDTIPVADFIYPRLYGASHSTSLLFVFNNEKIKKEVDWVQFNLKEIGLGTGATRFRFQTEDIQQIPALSFTEK